MRPDHPSACVLPSGCPDEEQCNALSNCDAWLLSCRDCENPLTPNDTLTRDAANRPVCADCWGGQ